MPKDKPDEFAIDCADWFAATLQREFPELGFEEGQTAQGRLIWLLKLPPQGQHSADQVDDFAYKTQTRLFMRHARLIAYEVVAPEDE